jgi:hypothetical protein
MTPSQQLGGPLLTSSSPELFDGGGGFVDDLFDVYEVAAAADPLFFFLCRLLSFCLVYGWHIVCRVSRVG